MARLDAPRLARSFRWLVWLLLGALTILPGVHARADFLISVSPGLAAPGSTGNRLEVTLTNTGSNPVELAAFSFGLSAFSSPGVTITQVSIDTTAPYIFSGQSFFGPFIQEEPTPPGLSVLASDLSDPGVIPFGVSVSPGATVGLGVVFYNVAAGTAPRTLSLLLDLDSTTLSSPNMVAVPITVFQNSELRIIPEPTSLILIGIGLVLGLGVLRTQRRIGVEEHPEGS